MSEWAWTDRHREKRLNGIERYIKQYGYTFHDDVEWLCTELRAAFQEIDRLENGALNLRENVDLLRREKALFVDRVRALKESLRDLKGVVSVDTVDEEENERSLATEDDPIRRTKEAVKNAILETCESSREWGPYDQYIDYYAERDIMDAIDETKVE